MHTATNEKSLKGRVYCCWISNNLPSYIRNSVVWNTKINIDHNYYVLCYDKNFINGEGWKGFFESLSSYPNFRAQEINSKDVFNDQDDFLDPICKSMISFIDEQIHAGESIPCDIDDLKTVILQLSVIKNQNNAWLDKAYYCTCTVKFRSKHGIKQMISYKSFISGATVVGFNNFFTFTTYLLLLDMIVLFFNIVQKDIIHKTELLTRFSAIILKFPYLHAVILCLTLSESDIQKTKGTFSFLKNFKSLAILREEIANIVTYENIGNYPINPQSKDDELYEINPKFCSFIQILCSDNDVERAFKKKQSLASNYPFALNTSRNIKTYQDFFIQREVNGCNPMHFEELLYNNIKIYLMLFMNQYLIDTSNIDLLRKFHESNPNYMLEHTRIKLQNILYPTQDCTPVTNLEQTSAEELNGEIINLPR